MPADMNRYSIEWNRNREPFILEGLTEAKVIRKERALKADPAVSQIRITHTPKVR